MIRKKRTKQINRCEPTTTTNQKPRKNIQSALFHTFFQNTCLFYDKTRNIKHLKLRTKLLVIFSDHNHSYLSENVNIFSQHLTCTVKKRGVSPNPQKRFRRCQKASKYVQSLKKRIKKSTKPLKVLPHDTREEPLQVS